MFQQGYNTGFQNGLCQQTNDPVNHALTRERDIFMWEGGYDVGFKAGREFRLAKKASETMLAYRTAQEAREQQRLKQKHSSVFWFLVWSLAETITRLVQSIKAIW